MAVPNKQNTLIITIILLIAFAVNNAYAETQGLIQQIKQKIEDVNRKPRIVFLITEDPNNYEAHKTVPIFAEMLNKEYGYKTTVLLGSGDHGSYRYPSMESLSKADLLVVFARRIALPHDQMNAIKNYLSKSKPLIGIRTANHAFTVNGKVEEGFEDWPAFVADILGCQNRGYGPPESGVDVSIIPEAASHPIIKDIQAKQWHGEGSIYQVAPLLDKKATVLLIGKMNDKTEPVAWTRTAGKSKVFYTSLGYPTDFQTPQFNTLLVNAIKWTLIKN